MATVLRILGKNFNVDNFNVGWKLIPLNIIRSGQEKYPKKTVSERAKNSQLIFSVSNAETNDLNTQIAETIDFLKKHEKQLNLISKDESVEIIALDFAFNSRIDRKICEVQFDYFPSELIRLAGKLNMAIWLSIWPKE
jgi:hypothetical protein